MIAMNPGLVDGLIRCLDVGWMRDAIEREIAWPDGLAVKEVHIRRFTPRPRQSFDVEYEISLDGAPNASSKSLALFGRIPRLACPIESREARGSNGGVAGVLTHLSDTDATLHTMDRDPCFPRFDECIDSDGIAGIIRRMSQSASESESPCRPIGLRSRMVSFRCGRRFVLRYDDNSSLDSRSAWAGKFFADDRGSRLTQRHRRLGELLSDVRNGAVGVPKVVGYDPDLHMMVAHWAAEPPINESMESAVAIARRAGEALSVLQSLSMDDAATASVDRDRQQLERWCDCIVALRGGLAKTAARVLQAIEGARGDWPQATPVPCHGDFYQDQLIVGEHRTTLLDLDTLSVGHPCMDLGNFLAHQCLWCLQHGYAPDQYEVLVNAAIDGYESNAQDADPAALHYFWASSLFRIGALHAFRCSTAHHTPVLWNMIEPVLTYEPGGIDCEHVRSCWHAEPDGSAMSEGRLQKAAK